MGNNLDREIDRAVDRLPAGEEEEDARALGVALLRWIFRDVSDRRLAIKALWHGFREATREENEEGSGR